MNQFSKKVQNHHALFPGPPFPASSYPFSLSSPSLTGVESSTDAFQGAPQQCDRRFPPLPPVSDLAGFLWDQKARFSPNHPFLPLLSDHNLSCTHYRNIWINSYLTISYLYYFFTIQHEACHSKTYSMHCFYKAEI